MDSLLNPRTGGPPSPPPSGAAALSHKSPSMLVSGFRRIARGVSTNHATAKAIDKMMDSQVGAQWGARALVALHAEVGSDGAGSPYSPFTQGGGSGGPTPHSTCLATAKTLLENPSSGQAASLFRSSMERDLRLVRRGYDGERHEQVRLFLLSSLPRTRSILLHVHEIMMQAKAILENMEAASHTASAPPVPSAAPASAAIEAALGKLASQMDELKNGATVTDSTLQLLDRVNDLEATVIKLADARNSAESGTPRNLADAIAAAAALSHGNPPPSSPSSAMPTLGGWCTVGPPPGLEVQARLPDYHMAWRSRPSDGAAGKSARKELAARLHADALLQGLPVLGDTTAYGRMRATMLENWFLYSYVIYNGDAGQATLLRGLRACATAQHGKTQDSRWEALTTVNSVREFLDELDILFRDPHHSAAEACWSTAKRDAASTLDYFRRLRPLMKSGESRTRARNALVEHLASRNERDCIVALQRCPLDKVDAWRDVLETYHAAEAKVSAVQPKTAARSGKTLAAFQTTHNSADSSTTMSSQGRLSVGTDLTVSQAAALLNCLLQTASAESGAQGAAPPHLLAAVAQAVTKLTDARGTSSAPGAPDASELAALAQAGEVASPVPTVPKEVTFSPPLATTSPSLAAFGRQTEIYDLAKVYEYLGLSPVPERRGPHMMGTHGKECLVCSQLMGYTNFAPHNDLKAAGYPEGSRALHNAHWCKNVKEAVERKAAEAGTPADEVARLLTKHVDTSTQRRA